MRMTLLAFCLSLAAAFGLAWLAFRGHDAAECPCDFTLLCHAEDAFAEPKRADCTVISTCPSGTSARLLGRFGEPPIEPLSGVVWSAWSPVGEWRFVVGAE